jgi:hypothetical protein
VLTTVPAWSARRAALRHPHLQKGKEILKRVVNELEGLAKPDHLLPTSKKGAAMRIAGRQVYEAQRVAAQVQKKREEQQKPTRDGADDGTVTTQDVRKQSLFDVLWPGSQSGQTSNQTTGHATPHAPHHTGATSGHKPQQPASPDASTDGTDKPSDSKVDIYV